MRRNKSSVNGFTLVEVIVVGVLLMVIGIALISIFNMYSNETRETSHNMRMQRQTEALMDEISRHVRQASRIVTEAENAIPDFTPNLVDPVTGAPIPAFPSKAMVIQSNPVVRFWFENDGVVQWRIGNGTPREFTVDGRPITVDVDQSDFILWADRRRLEVDLTLTSRANNGQVFPLSVQRGVFRCRL